MRVGFNTTLFTNPGDDFIREGILYLLKKVLPPFDACFVQKHTTSRWSKDDVGRMALDWKSCDVWVQAGSPIYGPKEAARAKCVSTFWKKAVNKSVFSLAAGAFFYSNWKPVWARTDLQDFVRLTVQKSRLLTVRDQISYDLIKLICQNAVVHLLPCTAFWAPDNLGIVPDPQYAILNFMPKGGHFGKAGSGWPKRAKEYYALASRTYGRCVAICHDQPEGKAALDLGIPPGDICFFDDHVQLLKAYSKGIIGVANRVHGACVMSAMGIPNLCVGTDTRLGLINVIGSAGINVRDMWSVDFGIDGMFQNSALYRAEFAQRMKQQKKKTENLYLSLLREAWKGHVEENLSVGQKVER